MTNPSLGRIVSSAHLADGRYPELSEFEFGLIIAGHAFQRWTVRAMAASGYPDMNSLDVLVLHTVRHRDRAKTLADICLVLNVEDTHIVNYAIRKLTAAGLVQAGRQGKEKTVRATPDGDSACDRYRTIRDQMLLAAIDEMGVSPDQLSKLSGVLRLMSGQYDQAARAAAVM